MVSLFFVVLVLACGAALTHSLRLPLNVAPLAGLAGIAVLTTWCSAPGAPPLLSSRLIGVCALPGPGGPPVSARETVARAQAWRMPLGPLGTSAAVPQLMP